MQFEKVKPMKNFIKKCDSIINKYKLDPIIIQKVDDRKNRFYCEYFNLFYFASSNMENGNKNLIDINSLISKYRIYYSIYHNVLKIYE